MLRGASAANASVVLADEGRVRSHMRDPGVLPESDFLPPVILVAGTRRDPDFEAHILRSAAGFRDQRAQRRERRQCLLPWCVGEWHVSVAISGDATEGCLRVTAEPDGNAARSGTQGEAAVIQ